MWELNPVLCRNVIIRGVTIASHGPNNDGCNPESSTDVLIQDCAFDTGDDCIAIKSGRNRDGRRLAKPCENIIIQGCSMKDGHGGVTIGSEMSGNVRNVFVDNCRMDSPNLDRALRLKTNSFRGGIVENVLFRNVTIGQVSDAVVHVDFFYEEGEGGPFLPVVRNIAIEDVSCKKSKYALYLRGFRSSPIHGVHLRRCTLDNVARGNVVQNVEDLSAEDVMINGKPMRT
jgi:polygalacturonase